MQQIAIQPVTGQEFTTNINGIRYDIRLKLITDGVVSYDISIDEDPVVQGFRLTKGELMLPYPHQDTTGNFFLSIPQGQDVDYLQFGQSQFLYYLNPEEVDEVRGGN